MPQGTLFTEDFLNEGIRDTDAFRRLTPQMVSGLRETLQATFAKVANPARLNEAQTEDRIVKPTLQALGWGGSFWVQERVEVKGRANVPDYLLFGSPEEFAAADRKSKASERYPHAIAVADAKAWALGLDRRGSGVGADETPSGQILRYLSRAEVQSERKIQWGILTNGRHWRLYYQSAKSRLEEYFEIDFAWTLGLPGVQGDLEVASRPTVFANDRAWSDHVLKIFYLMFRREAFLPGDDGRTFHQVALNEARDWEARVRESLAGVVFGEVFPNLMRALKRADLQAPEPLDDAYLATVREAAFTLLYRLLFALYAEDRDLLPKRDPNYGGLSRLRDEVAERIDAGTVLSGRRKTYAHVCSELFVTIDQGDDTLGVPPYNGGLFSDHTAATDLLDRAPLPDADFAPLLDRLARTEKGGRRVRINFRDLSVQQLGSIYERLLEYEPVADASAPDGIAIRLNSFARKGSGSYYTPDELVKLIIERTIGPLVAERVDTFREKAASLGHDRRRTELRLAELSEFDPAVRILDLKVLDPAMGSGHFLVSLVDYLSEAVTAAMGEVQHLVEWADYISPLDGRLNAIRMRIRAEADTHGWLVRDDQLVNKNLIKRFVLKRCVYGVDKNKMAVELAKVALWLHTFTAGAPLSFLDHHLKWGDSLFGEWVRKALDELAARGTMLISEAVRNAEAGIAGVQFVENLTDAEIAEVKASAGAYREVETKTQPLRKFLDFWQALKWLDLTDSEKVALRAALDQAFGPPLAVLGALQAPNRPAHLTDEALKLFHEGGAEQLQISGFGNSGTARDYVELGKLIDRAHALAAEQKFLHWQIAFPGVWKNWASAEPDGGFDAVIGNPPWDRMKMQEVEWFAARAPEVARNARAADRKRLIAEMKEKGDPLIDAYERASAVAETAMTLARRGGDYPLLSRGDTNIYSLFVERAQRLIEPDGIAGLLVPSGIASDLGVSVFFRGVATSGRVHCLFDFENRRGGKREPFFPDIDSRFKFSVFVCGGPQRSVTATECAFFLHDPPELVPEDQRFSLKAADLRWLIPIPVRRRSFAPDVMRN
jgi:Eco57I restriction-modification methylase